MVVGYSRVILHMPEAARIGADLIHGDQQAFLGAGAAEQEENQDESLFSHLQSFFYSPDEPLGARFVRWMLEQPEARDSLAGQLEVRSVHYAHPSPRDLARILREKGLASHEAASGPILARQVTVVLAHRENPDERFPVSAYFSMDSNRRGVGGNEPICLLQPHETTRSDRGRRLWEALVSAKRRSTLNCVLHPVDRPTSSIPSGL